MGNVENKLLEVLDKSKKEHFEFEDNDKYSL